MEHFDTLGKENGNGNSGFNGFGGNSGAIKVKPTSIDQKYDDRNDGSFWSTNNQSEQNAQQRKFLTEEECEYIGFQCAKEGHEGRERFEVKKKDILVCLDEEIEEEKIIYQNGDELLAEQAEILKQEMERIRSKLQQHLSSIEDIKKLIEIATEKRQQLEAELREKLLDWGKKKAAIVEAAIENSKKELKQLIDSYQELYTKRQEVNRQKFEDHKEANAEMLRRAQEEEQSLREEQEELLTRLAVLYLDKGSRRFAAGIVTSGVLTSLLASWLYFFHIVPEIDWLRPFEGLGMGFLLTCLIGFASYFYHGRIVEPRILAQKKRNESINYWLGNIEMVAASVIGFIATIILTHTAFFVGSTPSIFSFICFVLSIFCTGILVGYGLRMWKLLGYLHHLNNKLVNLSKTIIALQKPEPLDISNDEAAKFKKELNYHLERLYQLLSIKYSMPKYAVGYRDYHGKYYWVYEYDTWWGARLLRRLFFFLPVSSELAEQVNPIYNDEELADASFRIYNWERNLFPDVVAELENTRQALAKARLEERSLYKKLIHISEERDDLTKALRERLQQVSEDSQRLTERRRKLADDYQGRVRHLKRRKFLLEKALDTGYQIGLKYLDEIDTPRRLK